MSPFGSLVKTLFRINFSPRRFLGTSFSDSKLKRFLIAFALLYGIAAYVGAFGFLFFDLARTLAAAGLIQVLLMYMYLYAFGVAVLTVFFRADAMLFRFADYELLGAFPLKPRTLVGAKALVLMANVYVLTLFVTAPIAFSYFIFAEFNLAGSLMFLPAFLAVPLVPAVFAALLAYLVRLVTDRLPKNKTVNTVLMFAVFLTLLVASFSFTGGGAGNPLLNQQGFIAGLGELFPPMGWFAASVATGDPLSFVLLVGSGILLFAAFLAVLSKAILKTNTRAKNERYSSKKKTVDYHAASAFRTILAKEWRAFTGIPIYIFNIGFGPIILVLAAVASLFFADQVLAYFTIMTGGATLPVHFVVLGFAGFCVSMVYTSAVSLSIEGKRFWILRSMPVAPATVMDAKLVFNVLLGSIPALVAVPLFVVGFDLGVFDALAILLAVVAFSCLTSGFGSLVNLRFPKFQFSSEVEIVKQSLGAMIGVFGGFGFIAVEGFALYGLTLLMPWQYALLVLAAVAALLAFGVRARVAWLAENLFIKLGA